MRIVCVGGGPATLYFAILAKLCDAGHEITVIERDPEGATYGLGVVYWDDLLDMLYDNDMESARELRAASVLWQDQEIRMRSTDTAYFGGYGYSTTRAALLDVLTWRARELGVVVEHDREIVTPADFSAIAGADLVVAGDGANSRVRQMHSAQFGSQVKVGGNPYIWLGTDKVFDSFIFAFEETPAGWIWFHAYPSSREISTCIVECTEQTWHALGLDSCSDSDGIRQLETIFAKALDGHSLISQSRGQSARWLRFVEVSNETWRHENTVLMGDAAHTTHFTIGSGTRLAMMDAMALSHCLRQHEDLDLALKTYDERTRESLRRVSASARSSKAWFENVDRYADGRDAVDFSYAMGGRSGYQAPWRYQIYRATQNAVLRRIRRAANTGERWVLAHRRGERWAPRSRMPALRTS
ncbi:FAD-dependent monooxygenase [Pseudonocardia bannensis]|uniref:FAD-binding monooxygenase n=1 Tax=Pseudonocardia bannensis TaxID=630973 RepID=A0A848DSM5_9PSEU|nr:FAD-dependent monooxygenase [Pseudonocardia bannensis]NMH95513.1 FAD-binding monooxygenase [Pseudonocardia bannensis]